MARQVWICFTGHLQLWLTERLLAEDLVAGNFAGSSARPNLLKMFTSAMTPVLAPAVVRQAESEIYGRHNPEPVDNVGAASLNHRCALAFQPLDPLLTNRFAACLRRFERMVRDCAENPEP